MTTLHDFGGVLGQPLPLSFGLSQFDGHDSWFMCEVALSTGSHVVPSMTWMLHGNTFLEVRFGTCVESLVSSKKLDPTLNTSPRNVFA